MNNYSLYSKLLLNAHLVQNVVRARKILTGALAQPHHSCRLQRRRSLRELLDCFPFLSFFPFFFLPSTHPLTHLPTHPSIHPSTYTYTRRSI